MRRVITVVLLTLYLVLFANTTAVLAETQVIDTSVEYVFGEYVTFKAIVESENPIVNGKLFFQASNDTQTTIGTPQVSQIDDTTYELNYTHPIIDYPLPAFSTVQYRYILTLKDGDIVQFPWNSFEYKDNRFAWNELSESAFSVYWYEGDLDFAQRVLDTAQAGSNKIQNLLQLTLPTSLDIYIYPDGRTMQDALSPTSENWVAGHADPELGVIVVSLPKGPDQFLLMEQRIPHELMHVGLFEATDPGYQKLPTWLSEGLASQAELYPNPDYRVMLEYAAKNGGLLSMKDLCKSFPRDVSNALLAYAQSDSFTRYLYNTYGSTGLEDLITNYANGLDCDNGAKVALGKDLAQLERNWHREILDVNVTAKAFTNFSPWLIFMMIILVAPLSLALFGLRSSKDKKQGLSSIENSTP